MPQQTFSPDLRAQREYVEEKQRSGFNYTIAIGDAFIRGIRDIGYRSTATALDELIDNAIQAEAQNIHVAFGFADKSNNKPDRIAVIDDGHGMDPEMMRLAMIWGGTHRESDRAGFGRYGFGLPSASVSQGRRISIYSKPEGGELYAVAFDLDEIATGKYFNSHGNIIVPEANTAGLPSWIEAHLQRHVRDGFRRGTIVVIEKLDHLTWKTENALQRNLLEHFGIVYRNFFADHRITVQGSVVEPLDPLFLTDGYRYYDLDEERAISFDPIIIKVSDPSDQLPSQTIKVRIAYLPPSFGAKDKKRSASESNANERFKIMRAYNGFFVLRNGRQIDLVTKSDWLTFRNTDRYWKVEIDFPAALDQEFGITTTKQQVVVSERIWTLLEQAGLRRRITQLRGMVDEHVGAAEAKQDEHAGKRMAERAMEEAERFKSAKPTGDPAERTKRGRERLEQEVSKQARQTGRLPEQIEHDLLLEIEARRYKVELESRPDSPFYRVDDLSGQIKLYLNTAHRFFNDVYKGIDSTPHLRAQLELLLFAIGDGELAAIGNQEREQFYKTMRRTWSDELDNALSQLDHIAGGDLKRSISEAEQEEQEMQIQAAR